MRSLLKYLLTTLAGLAAALLIAAAKDIFSQTDTTAVLHILCDALFVVGVVMTGIGLLIFTCNEGTFDGIAYGVSAFINMFRREYEKKYDNYFDYKQSRANKKLSFGFIVICGLVFLAAAFVMYYFYRQNS